MPYKKPGVTVVQEFTQPAVPEITTILPPAIIGACNVVIEGQNANTGTVFNLNEELTQNPGATNLGVIVAFEDPYNPSMDVEDPSSVRVLLVEKKNADAFDYRPFVREFMQNIGAHPKKAFLPKYPYAEIKKSWLEHMPGYGVEIKNIEQWDASSTGNIADILETYNGFTFDADLDYMIFVFYKAHRTSEIKKQIIVNVNDTASTIYLEDAPLTDSPVIITMGTNQYNESPSTFEVDRVGGIIRLAPGFITGSDVYLTVDYAIYNPIYNKPVALHQVQDIQKEFGPIHPYNPVAYGAYLAMMKNGNIGKTVYAIAAETPNSQLTDDLDPDVGLGNALNNINKVNYYTLAVMADVKLGVGASTVYDRVESLINQNADEYASRPTIAMLGFKTLTSASNLFLTELNTEKIMKDINLFFRAKINRRIRVVFPPLLKTKYAGETLVIPGYFYGAMYAGLVQAYEDKAATPFTLKQEPDIIGFYYPNGTDMFFTDKELDIIAAEGAWILFMDENNVVKIRHQLTMDTTMPEKREDSIVRAMDFISKDLKAFIYSMMPEKNITPSLINNLRIMIANKIQNYIENELAGAGTQLVSIEKDPESPDSLIAILDYQPLYPFNRMRIVIRV